MTAVLEQDAGLRPPEPGTFQMWRRRPAFALADAVVDLCGYRESLLGHSRQVEAASLVAPLVISFGEPFSIGLGRAPGSSDHQASFAAGLFAGPVVIDSFGNACCIQVNFTPIGAYRFFGLPMHELADRIVTLDDILGTAAVSLRDRLGEEPDWDRRFDLVERVIHARLLSARRPTPSIAWAYDRLVGTGGSEPVGTIAARLECSRKHLSNGSASKSGLARKLSAASRGSTALCNWPGAERSAGQALQPTAAMSIRRTSSANSPNWQARLQRPGRRG